MPKRYGRSGSIHENVDAAPLLPEIKARTGVMQQREDATAVTSPP